MRFTCVLILVATFALPAVAQNEQGWTFAGSFNGSANSDGTVMKATPMLGYMFNRHFQTYTGLPVFFVNAPSTTSTATSTTSTPTNPGGFMSGLGNVLLGGRLNIEGESLNYSSTLELTAPTGDKTHGFSTGRVTADWTNRFSRRFNSFSPYGSAGLANTISDTNFFLRPFTSLGMVGHFEGGGTYDFSKYVRVTGSAYAIRAAGNQTIISRLIRRENASASSGTSLASGTGSGTAPANGKASVNATDNANKPFNTAAETVVPASAADDNGVSTWIGVTPQEQTDFYVGYSRSMHYDYNALFWGVGFRFGK